LRDLWRLRYVQALEIGSPVGRVRRLRELWRRRTSEMWWEVLEVRLGRKRMPSLERFEFMIQSTRTGAERRSEALRTVNPASKHVSGVC
jgi:hypothetical protein